MLRFGRYVGLRGPGLFWIVPFIDRVSSVIDQRTIASGFAAEQTLTADTVPVNVDAVLFWMVHDAEKAALEVQDYARAVAWAAQTALRDIIGRTTLADLLRGREQIEVDLQKLIDERSNPWGVTVSSVEMRDIVIPGALQDAMSRAGAGRAREAGAHHPRPGRARDRRIVRRGGEVLPGQSDGAAPARDEHALRGTEGEGRADADSEQRGRIDGHGRHARRRGDAAAIAGRARQELISDGSKNTGSKGSRGSNGSKGLVLLGSNGSGSRRSLAAQPAWRDPSPHQVRFVAVEPSVRLEVLDWGGTGRPIVFLSCYLTGHAFDDIAPKLTDQFHVYGFTRRGFGASDRPAGGYDLQRSVDDLVAVLDALKMSKPILVANSCGGWTQTLLAVQHPDRLGGLVYLEAADDPMLTLADYNFPPVDEANQPKRVEPPALDYSSFEAYRRTQKARSGVAFPEADLRYLFSVKPDGSLGPELMSRTVRQAVTVDARRKQDYANVRVPVLAIFSIPPPFEEIAKGYLIQNDVQRAACGSDLTRKNQDREVGERSACRRARSENRRAPWRQPLYVSVERGGRHSRSSDFAATLRR